MSWFNQRITHINEQEVFRFYTLTFSNSGKICAANDFHFCARFPASTTASRLDRRVSQSALFHSVGFFFLLFFFLERSQKNHEGGRVLSCNVFLLLLLLLLFKTYISDYDTSRVKENICICMPWTFAHKHLQYMDSFKTLRMLFHSDTFHNVLFPQPNKIILIIILIIITN